MVHIMPPAGWKAGVATAAAALAGTPADAALTISPSASMIIPADFAFNLPVEPTATAPPESIAFDATTPITVATAPSISPVIWWLVGGATVFVVAGLTYALWPDRDNNASKPAPTVAAVAAKPATKPPEPAADQNAAATPDPYAVDHSKDAPKNALATKPVEAVAPTNPSTNPGDNPRVATSPQSQLSELPVAPAEKQLAKVEPPVDAGTATPTPPQPAERPDAAASATSASAHSPVLKFDPLDFDPEHLSLATGHPASSTAPPPAASTSSIPAEPPGGVPPALPVAEGRKVPTAGDLLPPPAANQAVNVRRGPASGDETRVLDTAQHLATRVKSLQLTEMPLARFIDTLSDMAGAPITLDPQALELNGLSPRAVVSVDVADATLDKVLQDALSSQRLDLVEHDSQLRVALPNGDERRAVDFDVKDLVSGADAAPIAKLIERFIAPESWQPNGGKGTIEVNGTTLHIEQSLTVRREALIFCERLRLARGLSLRSKYPAALLTIESPYEKTATTLNQPTTFTFLAWTRLDDVVRQWQDMSGLTIVVDWSALREADLSPTTPLTCSATDRPWTEALDGVLEPLKLGWWAVDGQTLQITSLDALDRLKRVEFYTVPKKLHEQYSAGDTLVAALQKEIAEKSGKHSKPEGMRMELDEPSNRLIVRAVPDVQRYLSEKFANVVK